MARGMLSRMGHEIFRRTEGVGRKKEGRGPERCRVTLEVRRDEE